jgi:hypothetical protein
MRTDTPDCYPRETIRLAGTLCGALLVAALALSGCGAQRMVYLTADGRVVDSDPALSRQLAADRAICQNEMAKSVQGGDHGDGSSTRGTEATQVGDECMAEKGYVSVRQDQMAAKQRELAAGAVAPARN